MSTMLNYNGLRSLKLHQEPFRYVAHDNSILGAEYAGSLCEEFPEIADVGHVDSKNVAVSKSWKVFLDEIASSDYRLAMEQVTGLDLSCFQVGIGFRRLSKLSHGAPHCDVPRKRVTHLIYFNKEWPRDTGRLRILRSGNLEDVQETITPLNGHGVIFRVGSKSFHGFEPIEGERKAIQINFERTSMWSKIFARYEE
jgi:Rps23 Pro-64 3,4-dihydroxylase Tpa1-like proline 4-hydroxylase